MIGYLQGTIAYKSPGMTLLLTAGVGYELTTPASTYCALPSVGEPVSLLIYTHVREDILQLYGFASLFDRKTFEMLIAVNGVGPKAALAILGPMSGAEVCKVIQAEDDKTLCKAPGIGKKTAERIILELKQKAHDLLMRRNELSLSSLKVEEMHTDSSTLFDGIEDAGDTYSQSEIILEDLKSALENLGYKEKQYSGLMEHYKLRLEKDTSLLLEDLLKDALKSLSGHIIQA